MSLSILVNIAEAVLDESLVESAELERVIADLELFTNDPTTVLSLPRIFQAWGPAPQLISPAVLWLGDPQCPVRVRARGREPTQPGPNR